MFTCKGIFPISPRFLQLFRCTKLAALIIEILNKIVNVDAAAKSGGQGEGEVDNIVSSENSGVNVKRCDEDDFRCKNGLRSVGEVKRCSGFRCPDDRGGMCLREGATGCGTGEGCCDGLLCHLETGICMGQEGMKYT